MSVHQFDELRWRADFEVELLPSFLSFLFFFFSSDIGYASSSQRPILVVGRYTASFEFISLIIK